MIVAGDTQRLVRGCQRLECLMDISLREAGRSGREARSTHGSPTVCWAP
jgi:hypothetical protein